MRYIAGSTLANKKIEGLIRCFITNETARSAARMVGVSNKCAKFYYDLLLERLIKVGYYQPESVFEAWIIPDGERYADVRLSWYVQACLSAHKGLTEEKTFQYSCKYASGFFYHCLYQDLRNTRDSKQAFHNLMFRNIVDIIKITGALNQRPLNLYDARIYTVNNISVWYPYSWPKKDLKALLRSLIF